MLKVIIKPGVFIEEVEKEQHNQMDGTTCIVTIHGIGFQQPPENGQPGYADDLHKNLRAALNKNGKKLLGDDPNTKHGPDTPIYVQSAWPPGSLHLEEGIERLGYWERDNTRVCGDKAPLIQKGFSMAHVALVYSQLEGNRPKVGPTAQILAMLMSSASRYSGLGCQWDMFSRYIIKPKIDALLKQIRKNSDSAIPETRAGLCIRQDVGSPFSHKPYQHLTASWTLLDELENDVAAYVCQNELRQRVRGFVQEALLRLAARQDVTNIILNTHSNGTVIALDAIQELPPSAMAKIRIIITAGCPLRKYVDLFAWGKYIITNPPVSRWFNFWDPADIVADPLRPNPNWHRPPIGTLKKDVRGGNARKLNGEGICRILLPDGTICPLPVEDIPVNNLAHIHPSERGGLPAHNYWDNKEQFIQPVAEYLELFHHQKPRPNGQPASFAEMHRGFAHLKV